MPPVFGRYLPDPHPYDTALNDMQRSLDDTEKALAYNLMHDHRVSREREEAFNDVLVNPTSPSKEELNQALDDYVKGTIRNLPNPHYAHCDVNARNLLNGPSRFRLKVRRNQKLVRVLDLNGLFRVFQWAKGEHINGNLRWNDTFSTFPAVNSPDHINVTNWLSEKLGGPSYPPRSPQEVEAFIATVLDVLNAYSQQVEPYQPTWAALWSSFVEEGIDRKGPERWLESVGVHRPHPCWVILLKYSVRDVGMLARPTQLDAGRYIYHFPSPPQALLEIGGYAMDLRTTPRASTLIPEFIHNQINHSLKHWVEAGRKCELANPQVLGSLIDQRMAHYDLLCQCHGAGVDAWMRGRCI